MQNITQSAYILTAAIKDPEMRRRPNTEHTAGQVAGLKKPVALGMSVVVFEISPRTIGVNYNLNLSKQPIRKSFIQSVS